MDFLITLLGGYTKSEVRAARAVRTQTLIDAATEAGKLRDIEFSKRMANKDMETSRRLVQVFTELATLNSEHKPMKDHIQSLVNTETSKILDAEGSKKHAAACRAYENRLVGGTKTDNLMTALGVDNTKSQNAVKGIA